MIKIILSCVLFIQAGYLFAQTNTFPSSGNVGVGTTTPSTALEVNGSVTLSGTGQFRVGTTNWPSSVVGNYAGRHIIGGSNQPVLALWNEASVSSNNESSLILGAKNALGSTYIGGGYLRGAIENASDGSGYLSFLTTDYTSSFIERMRINSSGRLKIGTNNWPTSVLGSYPGRHIIGGNDQPTLVLWNEASVSANNESILILGAKNALGSTYIGGGYLTGGIENASDGSGYLSFFTTNYTSSFIERMRISSSGNIGIGITNPTEKLSVNGNISARKMIVTQTGWSDYVFDKNYKLRSLSSLESFIRENNHLPEVPPAKEVEEKGVNVGDTQVLLLKKIEELTLYVISQQKRINAQDKKIEKFIKKGKP